MPQAVAEPVSKFEICLNLGQELLSGCIQIALSSLIKAPLSLRMKILQRNRSPWKSLLGILSCVLLGFSASGKPQILTPPADNLGILPGEPVTFAVEATGNGPLAYQWRLNGVNIPNARSNTLTLTSVQLTNSGRYSVAVSDTSGTRSSRGARLTVKVPVIVDPQDNFADAFELSEQAGALRTYNTNATQELNEPVHAGYGGGKSVWFKVHPLLGGIMTLDTAGSDFDTVISVYSGSAVDQLRPLGIDIPNDDDGGYLTSRTSFNLPALINPFDNYYIAVDGFASATGEIALTWRFEITLDQLPTITSRPDRRTVDLGSDLNLNVGYDGQGALGSWLFNQGDTQVRENTITVPGLDDAKVGWYSVKIENAAGRRVLTKPANIQINIQSDGRADTNSFSFDKFPELAKTAMLRKAQLASQQTSQPTLQSLRPRPFGGGPASGYTSTQIFSTIYSSKEPGEPDHAGEAGGASEWFSFQPTNSGTLHINTDGSSYDTVLAVYTGPGDSFETLTEVASDNNSGLDGRDSKVIFPAVANTIYYIAVDGVGGARGTVRLNLNFGQPVAITAPINNQEVPRGTNVTFSVGATGSIALSYRWQFAGMPLAGATSSTLTVSNADIANVGQYTVIVSNLVNVVYNSAILTLIQPPIITTAPSNQVAIAGSSLAMQAVVTGSDPLIYQWFFQGNILVGTTATFVLTNIQPSQAGNYHVVVSNAAGIATSLPALLTINYPPTLSVQPRSQTVAAGAPVSLTVVAVGNPAPSYQWQWNGANLVNGGNVSGATSATLGINNFTEANAGVYRVMVQNALGTTTSEEAILRLNAPLRVASYGFAADGSFTIEIAGEAGNNYEVQVSSDFSSWQSLGTNFAAYGYVTFSEPASTNAPNRFYRLRLIP